MTYEECWPEGVTAAVYLRHPIAPEITALHNVERKALMEHIMATGTMPVAVQFGGYLMIERCDDSGEWDRFLCAPAIAAHAAAVEYDITPCVGATTLIELDGGEDNRFMAVPGVAHRAFTSAQQITAPPGMTSESYIDVGSMHPSVLLCIHSTGGSKHDISQVYIRGQEGFQPLLFSKVIRTLADDSAKGKAKTPRAKPAPIRVLKRTYNSTPLQGRYNNY
jgi:hypothetical protein